MKIEFETRPFVLPGRLLTVTEENAKAAALDWFIQELGHVAVDVPIATDNAGTQAYARYSLRTFLSPSSQKQR